MGPRPLSLPEGVPCAKGLIPYCLDEASKGEGARARLRRLRNAISALAPDYRGLEGVFDEEIVAPRFSSAGFRQTAVAYLRDSWFDPTSPTAHFPGHDVARIYAEGVVKALELALKGRRVVPLSAWWIVDAPDVRLLTLADVNAQGITIGGRVTLLIMTPRPSLDAPLSRNPILGDVADAWVTRQADTGVTTERVRDVAAAGA